jgi:hypothetical protein
MIKRLLLIAMAIGIVMPLFGQSRRLKPLRFTLIPGITSYKNDYSESAFTFNLFSGVSSSTRVLEISGISSYNTIHRGGIQLAGMANVIEPFPDPSLRDHEREIPTFRGIQISGLFNHNIARVAGVQVSGINTSMNFDGLSIAWLANMRAGWADGVSIAGLVNFSTFYSCGLALSGFINITPDDLYGFQVSPFNFAGRLSGPKSINDLLHGLQLGLFNKAKTMDGYQLGLINFGGEVKGVQVGLINFFKKNKEGVAVGLLNIGDGIGGLIVWSDNLFRYNYALSTGTNHLQNYLSFSHGGIGANTKAFGYALSKIMYDHSGDTFQEAILPINFIFQDKISEISFNNILISPGYRWGLRVYNSLYVFAGVNLSFIRNLPVALEEWGFPKFNQISSKYYWIPGFKVGCQIR